jgi:hypothetical protein
MTTGATIYRVKDVPKYFPSVTQNMVRHWIERSQNVEVSRPGGKVEVMTKGNGFDTVFVRKGRTIWISHERLLAWLSPSISSMPR